MNATESIVTLHNLDDLPASVTYALLDSPP
jgi:hypothetical protein